MSYKQNASSNRDALFGPPKKSGGSSGGGVGGPKHKREAASNRDALFGGAASGGGSKKTGGSSKSKAPASSSSSHTFRKPSVESIPMPKSSSSGYSYKSKYSSSNNNNKTVTTTLSGDAKIAKMKEADECRKQAKKAMAKGVFSRPDPIAAGTYYKKAADAYQLCGENRLERLHRIASADCNMGQGAYATAAAEFTRAADLAKCSDETLDRKRKEGWKLHGDAANAYRQMGEKGKAGKSQVLSALAMIWEDDDDDNDNNYLSLNKQTLTFIEESIEAHVPDPLNRYARYRQTGTSAFADPNAKETIGTENYKPSAETLQLAKHHMVTTSYAHEPMLELIDILVKYREYPSALYAAGAAAAILESDGIATISLSRIYVVETILTLAMGDPVAAEQNFLNVHVQKTEYLTSRDCKLAEDLFRSILQRDIDALEEARSPSGSNRASLANLQQSVRELVPQLRISGVARKQNLEKAPAAVIRSKPTIATTSNEPETEAPPPSTTSIDELAEDINKEKKNVGGEEGEGEEGEEFNADELQDELDNLMDDMGLGDDEEEEELSDDDLDLR